LGFLIIYLGITEFKSVEQEHRKVYLSERANFLNIEHDVSKLKIEVDMLLKRSGESFDKQYHKVSEITARLTEQVKQHAVKAEEIALLYDDLEQARLFRYIALVLGISLSLFGGGLWYRITQKNNDLLQVADIEASTPSQAPSNNVSAAAARTLQEDNSKLGIKNIFLVVGAIGSFCSIAAYFAFNATQTYTMSSNAEKSPNIASNAPVTVNYNEQPRDSKDWFKEYEKNRPQITKNQYDRIQEGMTYLEVVKILGVEGVEQGNSAGTKSYAWGKAPFYYLHMSFDKHGKLQWKVNSGLF
jgi:hypothetical protein